MDFEKKHIINCDQNCVKSLFGQYDKNKDYIEKELNVRITESDDGLQIAGQPEFVSSSINVLETIINQLELGKELSFDQIRYFVSIKEELKSSVDVKSLDKLICMTYNNKPIKPKTVAQQKYSDLIAKNDIVFGTGPAGTGKSFIAVAKAVSAFRNKQVEKIILTRPAVEAGENLGFLPGDLQMKVDPYLRPLYDALYDIMGKETFEKLKEKGIIEVAPLAYMRGRTLNNSFIILDEAQNTTISQMKMFLTRIGTESKAVINGDLSQVDLPKGKISGLLHATKILKSINGISIMQFSNKDVVRHRLVMEIIKAYEKNTM